MTKLQSKLPKYHGLTEYKLNADPAAVHAVIALVDVSKVTIDTDTGSKDPTVRILHVETINTADLPEAQNMLRHAIEKRTGATVLDGFEDDVDHDMKKAFGGA